MTASDITWIILVLVPYIARRGIIYFPWHLLFKKNPKEKINLKIEDTYHVSEFFFRNQILNLQISLFQNTVNV